MPKLFIRLLSPATATDEGFAVQSAWIITNEDEAIRAHGETDFRGLSDLVDPNANWLQQPENVVVTIPAEHVLALSCAVPGRSVGQVRKALPFVIEEFVTTDIERLHLAHAEIARGEPVRCNLIERSLLDDWLACLADLHIQPGYLIAETELLPVDEGQVSVLFDGEACLVRTNAQSATVDRENLALALAALPERRLLLINGDLEPLERARLDPETVVERMRTEGLAAESSLGFLATRVGARREAINLLQGAYRPRQQRNPLWQQWRVGAALAAGWIAVAFVMNAVEAIHASGQADALEAESEALFRDIYPDTSRVTNVRRQMAAAMGEAGGGAGLGLISHLGNLAESVPPDGSIQSLNYTIDRGELAVDLFVSGYEALDQLKARLGERGASVEIVSAEQQEQGVRARVRVREPGQGA